MKVKLTRKFSELIDDVNLSNYRVGDVIELPARDAKLLLAEEWASPTKSDASEKATASDSRRSNRRKRRR
jgi:hypothetical protein